MTNTDQITSDQHECYQNITTFLRDQGFGEQLKALLPLFPEELTNPHPDMTDEYGKAYAVVLPGGLSGVAVKASEGGYMFYGKDGYSSRGLLGKHDFFEVTALEIPRENEIGVTLAPSRDEIWKSITNRIRSISFSETRRLTDAQVDDLTDHVFRDLNANES